METLDKFERLCPEHFYKTVTSAGLGTDYKVWVHFYLLCAFTLNLRLVSWNLLSVMKPPRMGWGHNTIDMKPQVISLRKKGAEWVSYLSKCKEQLS